MTKVEIINKALTLIGAAPIVNITDDTNNARIMNRVYDLSLRSILSETCWNFATKRKLLATSTTALEWYDEGVSTVYARPSDVVRIFSTNDDNAIWREEGDYIISDTAGLGVKYVYYLDTPSKYPASFVDAFVDRLASDAAFMILNNSNIAQKYLEKYEKVSLSKARSENAQIGTQQYLKDDEWVLAKDSSGRPDLSYQ
jgi:hypothetical protein